MDWFDALFGPPTFTAAMASANARQADISLQAAQRMGCVRVVPAGITWERVDGRTHRVTIRREPEWVEDLSALVAQLGFRR